MLSKRSVAIASIALFIAVALGAAAWFNNQQADRLAQEKQALERTRSELDQARAALDQSVNRAQAQTEALNVAVEGSKQYEAEQQLRSLRSRMVSNGLALAAGVKTAMAEHYQTVGSWPASNQAIGLPAPSAYRSKGVQSLTVLPQGRIDIKLADETGKVSQVSLHGSVNSANAVTWRCMAPDMPDIAELATGCRYQQP
jgi:Pilin (bacterial filament)